MLVALVLFNIFHPGKIMAGKESDFPSRKDRKHLAQSHGLIAPQNTENIMVTLPSEEPTLLTAFPNKQPHLGSRNDSRNEGRMC